MFQNFQGSDYVFAIEMDKSKIACVKYLEDFVTKNYSSLFIIDQVIKEIIGWRFVDMVYVLYDLLFFTDTKCHCIALKSGCILLDRQFPQLCTSCCY